MDWAVYILKCKDQTLYTGISKNVVMRFKNHSLGKGAKYTRGRLPLTLVYLESCPSHQAALKRELYIKQQSRKKKWDLISQKKEESQKLWEKAKADSGEMNT